MKVDGGDVRVETPRLILRRYRESDFQDLQAMTADPGMFRYADRGPLTSDEAWWRLLRHVGHWGLLGYGVFALEEKETGRFVGEAGVSQFRRGLGERFDSRPEVTWSIVPDRQKRGYAREAAEAALAWFEEAESGPTMCMIHAANVPSLKLAERLGYRKFAAIDYKGYPALLFERPAAAR